MSTDHCAFRFEDQKAVGRDDFSKIPNGGPGIEHRLALLYTHGVTAGLIDMHRLVQVFSTTPAMLFGLFPEGDHRRWQRRRYRGLRPGRGEVISAQTHHMNVDYNMYEGCV